MILDKIENLSLYAGVNPWISTVVDFINTHDINTIPAGKLPIHGDELFANFCVAKGKTADEAVIESHNKMIDIQIVLEGEEQIGWTPRDILPQVEYNDEKDCSLYPGVASQQYVTIRPGYFALFLPQDGHAPCVSQQESYRKVIFKLSV